MQNEDILTTFAQVLVLRGKVMAVIWCDSGGAGEQTCLATVIPGLDTSEMQMF